MSTKRTFLALCLMFLMPANASAISIAYNQKGPLDGSLKGPYVVSLAGLAVDDNGDVGGMGANGVLIFDGSGGISYTDLTFTFADNAGEQFSCNVETGDLAAANYSVALNRQGVFCLQFNGAHCFNAGGTIDIGLVLPRSTGATVPLLITVFPSAHAGEGFNLGNVTFDVTIDGRPMGSETVATWTLTGSMYLQG